MITKFSSPSRHTLFGFLSLSIPALVFFAIRSPFLAFWILGIKSRIIVTILASICILLGAFGFKRSRQSEPTLITRVICSLGICLCITLGYYVWSIKLHKVT